jgi:topoisomerase-4 subunit A
MEENEEQLSNLEQQWKDYYLEYASYVVKDRAIPDVDDGMKPVQRRIMHCMHEVDDGRFNKVAGVVGDTMHYHPHGDASIAGALTVLANKGYFIERQGNFGNILTGDPAAAPRYIECRLTQLAKETLYNDALTEFVESYDGRNKEPVVLPCKVPALLMMGTEGIAVGMTTLVFSHNFNELLDAEIAILQNKAFKLYPDFQQGGIMDVKDYADGNGTIKLRAKIERDGDRKVVIREIPSCTTTEALIESIEKASKNGKIKIQSISDFTAHEANIEIVPQRGVNPDDMIRELYAYTDCEMSSKGTLRVICDGVPRVMTVSDVLRRNTMKLVEITKKELELQLAKLEDEFHYKSLVKIFIENKVYKVLETCESQQEISDKVFEGCNKYRSLLRRDIVRSDIDRLVQLPIRNISHFDSQKNEDELAKILKDIDDVNDKLKNIVDVVIAYIRKLKSKYGDEHKRRTKIEAFESIDVKEIARQDVKVYYDAEQKLLGTAIKSDRFVTCTEFDRIVIIKPDGIARVVPLPDKDYVGDIMGFYVVGKDRYHSMLYADKTRTLYAKVFTIGQYTMNKDYRIIPEGNTVVYLKDGAGGKVHVSLEKSSRRKTTELDVDFSNKSFIRSRESRGVRVSAYPYESIS